MRNSKIIIKTAIVMHALALAQTAVSKPKTIHIGSDPWCPYQCFDKTEPYGITLDIMKAIFEPQGYKVTMANLPWARAIQSLRDGEITTFGSAAKADAPDIIFANEPTTNMRNTIFKSTSDSWKFKDMNSLTEGTLGIIQSYTYGEAMDAYIAKNSKFVDTATGSIALESNIRKLIAKRIRFIIDDENIILFAANRIQERDKIAAAHVISEVPLHFGFSPKNPNAKELAKITSHALQKMKKDGSLARIYAKYGLQCTTCKTP